MCLVSACLHTTGCSIEKLSNTQACSDHINCCSNHCVAVNSATPNATICCKAGGAANGAQCAAPSECCSNNCLTTGVTTILTPICEALLGLLRYTPYVCRVCSTVQCSPVLSCAVQHSRTQQSRAEEHPGSRLHVHGRHSVMRAWANRSLHAVHGSVRNSSKLVWS